MPSFTTYYGPSTVITEQGVWVTDGTRRICIFYTYTPATGILKYAACVYRCCPCVNLSNGETGYIEPSTKEMEEHSQTAGRRFEIRPVIFQSNTDMSYEEIIKTIRHEMCHGFGVKGPRGMNKLFYDEDSDGSGGADSDGYSSGDIVSEGSELEFLTDSEPVEDSEFDWEKVYSKPTRKMRYFGTTSIETYKGEKVSVDREFFIAMKGVKKTGELIYAAAISRRPSHMGALDDDAAREHFKTAIARLDSAPVAIVISEEYRHQLKSNAPHREDVTYEIIDSIMSKPGGRYLIKDY